MGYKTVGVVLLIVGLALVALSILADTLGVGGQEGFGWKQVAGVIVGGVSFIVGLAQVTRKGSTDEG